MEGVLILIISRRIIGTNDKNAQFVIASDVATTYGFGGAPNKLGIMPTHASRCLRLTLASHLDIIVVDLLVDPHLLRRSQKFVPNEFSNSNFKKALIQHF